MKIRNCMESWVLSAVVALALAGVPPAGAQSENPSRAGMAPARHTAQSAPAQAPSEQDVAATQEQLLKLLRLSPVLTSVVARDPSLLADQQYVERNNPELAQFIESHPDVAKNPEFYLFSRLESNRGHRDQALERAVWPDLAPAKESEPVATKIVALLIPILSILGFFTATIWIIYVFVQSRRWNRLLKQQSEVHGRLIDKFGTSQELTAYLGTEAGQRFLMASPMALTLNEGQRMPNTVARVLTPLQAGVVMTLLGMGFLFLRHAGPGMETPMKVVGTLVLMPGIGFILSAAVTWALAHRLGLMPDKNEAPTGTGTAYGSQDRQ